ncbi:hypothetical protein [Paenibacillus arenilitoris]|uniref:Spore coat protein n=1 Tax=Paenibacillus arenilitoris TaxID=2772299 RepID=A0A927CR28_9BACL|nr:hypothetical protein [Paenibacillus arenilitoris]MBD2871950.1 hypothetical protein [Paenibacillus arenilitoris]
MKRNYYNNMGNVGGSMANMGHMGNVAGMANMGPMGNVAGMANMGPMGNVAGASDAEFCPDCPTQTVFDPPVTLFEDVYHPQLVNVVQNIETVKKHHCCPVYKHHYTHSEKNVMVSSVNRRKRAKTSSRKRSKK